MFEYIQCIARHGAFTLKPPKTPAAFIDSGKQ